VAVAGGCATGRSNPAAVVVGGQRVPVSQFTEAVAGLCQARRQAPSDSDSARRTFYDRSHATLHLIARALDDVDRAQEAQLLEAKNKVESTLDPPGPHLTDDLLRLADVYRASLGRLAITAPPCAK
jgi:hypothetical protein